jgi:uncharacterized short protein YbdD (DUF466 family)
MLKKLKHLWHLIRELSGDSAYEQYLKHHAQFHAQSVDVKPALTRKEFSLLMLDVRWKGINRCC